MKSLKFTPELTTLILAGEKTSTWRLFDDKDLTAGDTFTLVNKETGEVFGHGVISMVVQKSFARLTNEDWEGHERYNSAAEMYATYSGYYKQPVGDTTEVKIVHFSFSRA